MIAETALHNIREIRPSIEIIELSAKRGTGMDAWLDFSNAKSARLIKINSRR